MVKVNEDILDINIIKKAYGSNNTNSIVLENINFTVSKGDFISILGTSGVGKTTLLRIIAGLDTDFEGTEIVLEESNDLSVVFQEHRLLPWMNVEQNIKFALPNTVSDETKNKRVKQTLEMVGLRGREKFWIKELSGGMAQRVAIARALVNNPRLLILDEPFASLDAFTKFEIQQELRKIVKNNDITCVMVTHDFDEAIFLSNRIIILEGSPATIKTKQKILLENKDDRTTTEFNKFRKWLNNEFFG